MTNKLGITIDDSELKSFVNSLSVKKTKELYRKAIKKAAFILRDETVRRFSRKYKYKGVWKQAITRKSGKQAVKTREAAKVTSKIKGGEVNVKVHIMEDYRVKWLEKGTKNRYTKGHRTIGRIRVRSNYGRSYVISSGKPERRGRTDAGWFFKEARQQKKKAVQYAIQKNIEDVVKMAYIKSKHG